MSNWTEFQKRSTPGRRVEDFLKDEVVKSKRTILSFEEILRIISFVISILIGRHQPKG